MLSAIYVHEWYLTFMYWVSNIYLKNDQICPNSDAYICWHASWNCNQRFPWKSHKTTHPSRPISFPLNLLPTKFECELDSAQKAFGLPGEDSPRGKEQLPARWNPHLSCTSVQRDSRYRMPFCFDVASHGQSHGPNEVLDTIQSTSTPTCMKQLLGKHTTVQSCTNCLQGQPQLRSP